MQVVSVNAERGLKGNAVQYVLSCIAAALIQAEATRARFAHIWASRRSSRALACSINTGSAGLSQIREKTDAHYRTLSVLSLCKWKWLNAVWWPGSALHTVSPKPYTPYWRCSVSLRRLHVKLGQSGPTEGSAACPAATWLAQYHRRCRRQAMSSPLPFKALAAYCRRMTAAMKISSDMSQSELMAYEAHLQVQRGLC